MTARAKAIDAALAAAGVPARAAQEQRYLKSARVHYGVAVPVLRKLVRAAGAPTTRAELLATAAALWKRDVHETCAAAVMMLVHGVALLAPRDLPLVERMLRTGKSWAYVDELAANVVGPLVEAHPALGKTLDRWARDDDFWIRRAAMLALLVPLRRGGGDFARFGRYADAMLDEREFFIRKAIGWILRETSKRQPQLVFDWLLPRAARASGLTVREAVKYLPAAQRAAVLRARS